MFKLVPCSVFLWTKGSFFFKKCGLTKSYKVVFLFLKMRGHPDHRANSNFLAGLGISLHV